MNVDCGSARDRLGVMLGGTYELKAILGAGGTAVVYRAETADGRPFAVKVLHDHLSHSEEVCRRFVREGQLGNVLEHPGIVRVLDHGTTEEGCPYLVLELLEGESLEQRRERLGGRLELAETLDLCDQLLAVLEEAHAKNIVHRDIKPANLFLTKQGRLKVLDFGIARLVDDTSATATKTGQMVGTPAFMPPEQALSRPRDVDARTDLWSVGATLFTLLSGEHVHVAESSSEHLIKAATIHARSLAKALMGVPANVEALTARSLAFDKSERYASASEMRVALAAVRDDPGSRIGISTHPPPDPSAAVSIAALDALGSAARLPAPPSSRTPVGLGWADETLQEKASDPPKASNIDALMSLTTNPGADERRSRPRKWLLPLAIVSTSLFVVMTVVALVLAIRTPSQPSISVASAAPPRVEPEPPITVTSATVAETAPAPTTPTTASASPSTAPATGTAPVAPTKTAVPPTATPPKKAPPTAKSATSRKDLYRPF